MLAVNIDFVPQITLMGFVSYTSPWMHFKRTADQYIMYFIKSGELHIEENGIRYILKKGDVLVLEPNLNHEGFEKQVCDYYYIHFKHPDISILHIEDLGALARTCILEDQQRMDGNMCYLPKAFTVADKASFSQFLTVMNEMVQLYRRKNYNRSLTALKLSELFIRLSREHLLAELQRNGKRNTKSYAKMHELLDYIHHHYQSKITSADIEALFECNFDYMNRIFHAFTGHSITQYVNKVRIEHAQELIDATHLSFGEIAYLVGFRDPYYFSKVFKKHVGLSPIDYYKRGRGGE